MNISAELLVILLNLLILFLAYFLLHPLMAGNNLKKLIINDVMSMICALVVIGYLFWSSKVKFDLMLFDSNWLVFGLITYSILEIPFFIYYIKKHKIDINDI